MALEVGGVLLGLASTRQDVRDHLSDALAPFVVQADVQPNYTLSVAERPQDFHRLSWGGCVFVRTRDPGRLIQALANHLGGHAEHDDSTIRTEGLVLVRDGMAYLAPPLLRQRLPSYESALRRAGFIVAYNPWADIDLRAAELVVPEPLVPVRSLEGLAALAPPPRRREDGVAPGRYPLARWVFEVATANHLRTDAVVLALGKLAVPARSSTVVADFAGLFERVPFAMARVRPVEALLEVLTEQP